MYEEIKTKNVIVTVSAAKQKLNQNFLLSHHM